MTTAHRRNSNATHPNNHIRSNYGIHTRPTGSRTPVPFGKDAVPRAGFDVDDGGLSGAMTSLTLSPVSNHPRTTSSGSSTGSMASTSSSRFERTNNVPPRHRGGEKEYTQLGLQSPREKQRGHYFEQQQPPRRQNQQHATGYYNSSKYQLQPTIDPRSQSIPPSPSRLYAQNQSHKPTHSSRASTAQSSPLHPNTELPLVSWGPVYNYNPAVSMRQVQLQLQEWYQQQQCLGELPHARPLISPQASQQLAPYFTSQQTRSNTSSPPKGPSSYSRPPSGNTPTRVSPSQTHRQQTKPQPAHVLSNSTSPVHLLASHPPPLTQPTSYAGQATQSLRVRSQDAQMAQSRSLQARLSDLPPLSSLWSDSAANQTLAYLHQTLLNEYDIPARDLTVVHYQRLYDGYFEELERDLQRGEDRMWVMGMALEEDERTAARERAEGTVARDAEETQHDAAQDLAGSTAAHME